MESQFGKFKLLQRIGGGKLSQVFRVSALFEDEGDPRVALKRVHPEVIGEAAFVRLVVREAGVLTRLSHPSLCNCLELGVIDGSAFLTLELVNGCTLRALMRRLAQLGVKLPVSAVVAMAHQLMEVMEYLHRGCQNPLVHLDLSPQNVMISRDGTVRLIDFGLARYLDGHNPPPLGGKIAGTVGYMSPEQASGAAVNIASDQFGLAILMWEMLSGQRLYRGNTPATWQRMRAGSVPAPERAMPRVPEPLRRLVSTMLTPDPGHRFPHLGEAQAHLEAFFPDPRSGQKALATLVSRLLSNPMFDPFDVVYRVGMSRPETPENDIPTGEAPAPNAEYADLSIEVDFGTGSPASQVRAVIPDRLALPDSPFLETLPEPPSTDLARDA